MKFNEDRRCATIKRVSHTALVDICSLEEEGFPFQGESCNISGRGMHVRGSYLPEIGESLVCRFNHDDEEVLVEGRVAWRSEGEDSGEFGIQFTALDADCAELLRGLGQPVRAQSTLAPVSRSLKEEDGDSDLELESGERVRLHIEGLGAPMKASVVEGSTRKVRVGSALEFLKMGRSVELEEIVGGQRRGALVDSVNVVIHPTTSVPELVVQLRYEGISPTPAPVKAVARDAAPAQGRAVDDRAFDDSDDHLDHDEEHPWQPTAEALKERFSGAVESAGGLARQANGILSTLARSVRAKTSSEKPLKKTSTRVTRGAKPERAAAVRRTQAAGRVSQSTPSHLRSGIHDMKLARGAQARTSQPGSRGAAASEKPNSAVAAARRRKLSPGLIFAAAFLVLGGSALGFRSRAPDQAKVASSQANKDLSSQAEQTTSKKSSAQSVAVAPPSPDQDGPQGAVVAEVPLFGQQTVATARPEVALSKVSDAEAELRAAAAAVGDQSFDEPEEVENMKGDKPWGRGRLYLPTIHRIRLDGAGVALSGAVNSDGFTVVVSGRKVMESGKAIQKRDKRIVAVKADNEGPNAKIRFEFRGPVPPYRVRLRQDFVEFLISAPEETVAHL